MNSSIVLEIRECIIFNEHELCVIKCTNFDGNVEIERLDFK